MPQHPWLTRRLLCLQFGGAASGAAALADEADEFLLEPRYAAVDAMHTFCQLLA
jgi:hypothetical protein